MQAKIIGHLVYEKFATASVTGTRSEQEVEEPGRSPNNLLFHEDIGVLGPDALNSLLLTLQ